MVVALACIAIFTFSLLFVSVSTISLSDIEVSGPGLQPSEIVLPARYFYVFSKINESLDESALRIVINGSSDKETPCRVWVQILDRKDGSFIIRYKLYESCYNFQINVMYESAHIGGSPFFDKGPVHSEDCDCPHENIEEWLKAFGCKGIKKQIQDDLSIFPTVDFNKLYDVAVRRFNNSVSSSVCHYVIKDNKVYRKCYGQHIGFKIFMDAILLSLTRKVVLPNMEFFSNLGDWPLISRGKHDKLIIPMFSWCGSFDTFDIVMPTYDITESSLECMGRVSLDMLSVQGNIEKTWEEKEKKAFWRGRDSNRARLKLIEISRKHPDLINASLTNFFFFRSEENKYGPKENHISFFKFFDYKYQLNMDGTVAAYRFPYLLAGDSLVFKQDSKYYEHFYSEIQPWKHYIPVKENLENLVELLQWALENDEKARDISQEGQKFAKEHLLPQDVFCYYANLFYEWSKKLVSRVFVRKGMEHVEQKGNVCVCKQRKKDEL